MLKQVGQVGLQTKNVTSDAKIVIRHVNEKSVECSKNIYLKKSTKFVLNAKYDEI